MCMDLFRTCGATERVAHRGSLVLSSPPCRCEWEDMFFAADLVREMHILILAYPAERTAVEFIPGALLSRLFHGFGLCHKRA